MEIKIQSIHFDATEKLEAFIEKKVAKLEKSFEIHLRKVLIFVWILCVLNYRNLRKN